MASKNHLAKSALHTIPSDLRKALNSSSKLREKWNSLTPLSRNEWICWTTSVKMRETRKDHVKRVREELLRGKRRPCCWAGCGHRKE